MHKLLATLSRTGGSDLFIAAGFPPSMKSGGSLRPLGSHRLAGDLTRRLAESLMNEHQRERFERDLECNFALALPDVARFRVSVYQQQRQLSMVIRAIAAEIPSLGKLGLPAVLEKVAMSPRGLVLAAGAAGSGKSTVLAAMLDHRNRHSAGHIITVEDPLEYVHASAFSLVTHREVGTDTHSWHDALENVLRQAPDAILIGEIRDAQTMQHALAFAETGHLCLATLHAAGPSQAIERVAGFFPQERRAQVLASLSVHLRAVVSQRLVQREEGSSPAAAAEILLNLPAVAERVARGGLGELKTVMAKSREQGMQTFEQALFDLYEAGHVSLEEALRHADAPGELRMAVQLRSKRARPQEDRLVPLSLEPESPAGAPNPRVAVSSAPLT